MPSPRTMASVSASFFIVISGFIVCFVYKFLCFFLVGGDFTPPPLGHPLLRGVGELSDDHLLDLHVVAVDESDHVDARSVVDLALIAATEGLAADDVAEDVNHLDGGLTLDAKDAEVAAGVDEAEAVAFGARAGGKHQLEAALVVGGAGVEAVARAGEQVDIFACEVVDEMQVAEVNVFVGETQRVAAVLLRLEVDGHLAHMAFGRGDGVVLAFDRHVDLAAVLAEGHLAHLLGELKGEEVCEGFARDD